MATYRDGNVRKATPNSVTAAKNSAERRRCPKCRRKSAVVHSAEMRMTYCRWSDPDFHPSRSVRCDYVVLWDAQHTEGEGS